MKKWLLVCFTACLGWGQAAPAFDVTTVRPNLSGTAGGSGSFLGGRLKLSNFTLKNVLTMAYQVKPFQVVGGPGWMGTDKFDIEGKTEKAGKFDEAYPMIQTMLAERFQVRLHRETRELLVYRLVTAKGGIKMQAAGDSSGFFRTKRGLIEGKKTKMQTLADLLASALDRLVVNQTGQEGEYDFKLQWTPDESEPKVGDADTGAFDPAGPSIFTAVQEQLGLRLESAKAPVEVLVIDRAEKPSEN
jgi:uncharacterized protein (TIGR03435 family)